MNYRFLFFVFFISCIFYTLIAQINNDNSGFKDQYIKDWKLLHDTSYTNLIELPLLGLNLNASSNPRFSSFIKNESNKTVINLYDYQNNINVSSHHLLSLNNILFHYALKQNKKIYSFGVNHHFFAEFSLSKELTNLLVNGNYGYLDQTLFLYDNNYARGFNYFSMYFGYSSKISEKSLLSFKFKFLKGVNSIGLNIQEASFLFTTNLSTDKNPFSLDLESEAVYFRNRDYNLLSNLGCAIDFYLDYDITERSNLYINASDLGFIIWTENQYVSDGDLYFDGLDFSLDQILATEYNNLEDTITDVFQLNKTSNSEFRVLNLDVNVGSSYYFNDDMSAINLNYSVKKLYDSFLHTVKFSYLRYFKKYNFSIIPSYSINRFSYSNFSICLNKKWNKKFISNIYITNMTNSLSIESDKEYLGFGTQFYILF